MCPELHTGPHYSTCRTHCPPTGYAIHMLRVTLRVRWTYHLPACWQLPAGAACAPRCATLHAPPPATTCLPRYAPAFHAHARARTALPPPPPLLPVPARRLPPAACCTTTHLHTMLPPAIPARHTCRSWSAAYALALLPRSRTCATPYCYALLPACSLFTSRWRSLPPLLPRTPRMPACAHPTQVPTTCPPHTPLPPHIHPHPSHHTPHPHHHTTHTHTQEVGTHSGGPHTHTFTARVYTTHTGFPTTPCCHIWVLRPALLLPPLLDGSHHHHHTCCTPGTGPLPHHTPWGVGLARIPHPSRHSGPSPTPQEDHAPLPLRPHSAHLTPHTTRPYRPRQHGNITVVKGRQAK